MCIRDRLWARSKSWKKLSNEYVKQYFMGQKLLMLGTQWNETDKSFEISEMRFFNQAAEKTRRRWIRNVTVRNLLHQESSCGKWQVRRCLEEYERKESTVKSRKRKLLIHCMRQTRDNVMVEALEELVNGKRKTIADRRYSDATSGNGETSPCLLYTSITTTKGLE